jgi:hypothetical protein
VDAKWHQPIVLVFQCCSDFVEFRKMSKCHDESSRVEKLARFEEAARTGFWPPLAILFDLAAKLEPLKPRFFKAQISDSFLPRDDPRDDRDGQLFS